jgi:hypothetical protein
MTGHWLIAFTLKDVSNYHFVFHVLGDVLHVGVNRAECLMWSFFESKNQRKCIIRLGDEDHGTVELEKLLMLNSFAKSVGMAKLPYEGIKAPIVLQNELEEFMGFNCPAIEVQDVSNPTDNTGNDVLETVYDDEAVIAEAENVSDTGNANFEEFLADTYGVEEIDIEVPVGEDDFPETNEAGTTEVERQLEALAIAETARLNDQANYALINQEMSRLLPNGSAGNESTMQAFKRFTNNCPWIPFRDPFSAAITTETDSAESDLFASWRDDYDRNCQNNLSRRHYHHFQRRWNDEVSRRFTQWCNGDNSVIQINYKSTSFLQVYFDKRREWESLQQAAPAQDPDRQSLNVTLRNNRGQIEQPPQPFQCSPPANHGEGTTPFGNPTTLNSIIVMGAIEERNQNNPVAPYRFVVPVFPVEAPLPQRPVRSVFRSKKCCNTCGWRKKEHNPSEGMQKKDDPCKRH